MKKAVLILFGVILTLVVVAAILMQVQSAAKTASNAGKDVATVERGDLILKVVETGTIDAVKAVDVRSRASGRLKRLLVEEGEFVTEGQLIAVIDPLEIELRVSQDRAQLQGAQSGASRAAIEIEQRRVTAKSEHDQAVARLAQLRKELDAQPTLTRTAIEQARAALRSSQQERERLAGSVLPTQRTAVESELRDSQASFETAQRDYERIEELARLGYVAGQALDAAKLRRDQASIRLEKARSDRARLDEQQRLDLMKADEDVRSAQAALDRAIANGIQDDVKRREYESAIAAVDSAKARLRDVEVLRKTREQSLATVSQLESALGDSLRQLRETQVRATMDGVVSKKYIEVGDMVTGLSAFSQGTAIVRIEDRTALRVKLEINEIDVARLKRGMRAEVDVDAFPDKKFAGRISKIAPASTAMQPAQMGQQAASGDAVVKYEVEILLDKADPSLRSGMSAKCTFETLRREKVLRLLVEFVGKDKDGRFVMLAPPKDSKEKPKRQAVQVGATSGAFVEILSGVKEGDRVARPEFTGPERRGFFQAGPEEEQAPEEPGGGPGGQ